MNKKLIATSLVVMVSLVFTSATVFAKKPKKEKGPPKPTIALVNPQLTGFMAVSNSYFSTPRAGMVLEMVDVNIPGVGKSTVTIDGSWDWSSYSTSHHCAVLDSAASQDLLAETRPLPGREDGATLLILQRTSASTTAAAQKQSFIFDLLHKVRTPLTTIVSVLAMATSERLDPKLVDMSELLSMGAKQAERLTVFLARLRDLFMVETGTLDSELCVEPVTVAVVMGQVAADLRSRFNGKRQTLVEDYPNEDVTALVDPAVLGRALELVALNAHQYTPERGTVRMGAERLNGSVSIRISDDGPGIPEEEMPRLFERFFRGSTAVSSDVDGEGLGLYLARQLLLSFGATIHLDSRPGEGTEVEILLPAAEKPA